MSLTTVAGSRRFRHRYCHICQPVSGGTGEATINNSTGRLTVTKAGTIKLKALKVEDDNYLETLSPALTLTVHKAEQADLLFTSSDDMVFEREHTATATGGSSTGSLSYVVVSGGSGAAAINDDTGALTVTRAGTVLIKVTRAGDDNWLQRSSHLKSPFIKPGRRRSR